MPIGKGGGSAGGAGTVTSVAATDTSIVVAGTAVAPTIATGTLDVIATVHPPAAAVPMNAKKITGLASGSAVTDAAAFGQIPTASSGFVATSEATSSGTYTDLATVGPAATVTVTASGIVLVGFSTQAGSTNCYCSIAVSGATTTAASDLWSLGALAGNCFGRTYAFTGLAAGATTFTVKYKSATGSVSWGNRSLWAIAF